MKFNPTKCVAFKQNLFYPLQYSLYDQKLKHVSEAKYLGLTLGTNLNFNKKANATLERNAYYCQQYVKVDVQHLCNYLLHGPNTINSICKLESVQR